MIKEEKMKRVIGLILIFLLVSVGLFADENVAVFPKEAKTRIQLSLEEEQASLSFDGVTNTGDGDVYKLKLDTSQVNSEKVTAGSDSSKPLTINWNVISPNQVTLTLEMNGGLKGTMEGNTDTVIHWQFAVGSKEVQSNDSDLSCEVLQKGDKYGWRGSLPIAISLLGSENLYATKPDTYVAELTATLKTN